MGFLEDVVAASSVEREFEDVEVLINGHLHLIRVTQMDGLDWAAEVDAHPARPGVLLDMRYGYNLRSIVKRAGHKCSRRLEGDEWVGFRVDPIDPRNLNDPDRVDEWAALVKVLPGSSIQRLGDALFGLNETRPAEAVEAAKKALRSSKGSSS